MKKIYLVRHCSAAGQHKDSPLTTEGMRQAQLLSFFLSDHNYPIDRIISSPYLRAIESVKPYAASKGLNIEVDDRLKERILSEEPVDDWIEVLERSFIDHDYRLHGGESANTAIRRANQVIEGVFNTEESHVMLVTHGNLLALLLKQYDEEFGFNQWKELRHPDIYTIDCKHDNYTIERLLMK